MEEELTDELEEDWEEGDVKRRILEWREVMGRKKK